MPNSRAMRSRKAYISGNFQVVSTWSRGKGGGEGWKALRSRCSITEESLADRIEHDRAAELAHHLAHDMDGSRLEPAQV